MSFYRKGFEPQVGRLGPPMTLEDNMPEVRKPEGLTYGPNMFPKGPRLRAAIVKGGDRSLGEVQAYLPSNYDAAEVDDPGDTYYVDAKVILIVGYDNAGWTLDGYVIPRLASGLIFAQEVTA